MSSKSSAVLHFPSAVFHFTVVACVALTVQQAFGQAAPGAGAAGKVQYTSFPVTDELKRLDPAVVASDELAAVDDAKRVRAQNTAFGNARKVLAGQLPFDDSGKQMLDKWYKGYFLPNFTSPESRSELPGLRDKLLNDELRTARSPAAVAHVRGLVMTYMKAYVQNQTPKMTYNFDPVVRYNAMLVIGALNAVEFGARTANDQKALVPDPLPEALDLLISEFKSPTQIDAVRVAALVGIDRHVKLDLARPKDRGIPGPKKKVIFDEMISLLSAAPPAGRTAEGHIWMQRRAIDILAALGVVGIYPEANAALEKIVADKDAPISLRCTASEALAQWSPTGKKIDASTVSHNLGLIAVKACKDELDRIAALERQEKEMKELRELIKKPNAVATGQFGAMAGGGGSGMNMNMGMGESYGAAGAESEEGNMYSAAMDMDAGYSAAGGSGMYGPTLGGAAAEVPTDPRVIWSRRRLKYQLTCVKRGLDGMVIAGKSSQQEKEVDQVAKAVEAALALTDPPAEKPTLEGMAESIRKGVLGLAFLAPEVAEIAAEPVDELPPASDPATPAAPPVADPAADPATVDPAAADPAAVDPAAADPAAADPAAPAAVAPGAPAVDPLADPADPAALPPGLE